LAFTDVNIHVASRVLSYKKGKTNISFSLLKKNDVLKTLKTIYLIECKKCALPTALRNLPCQCIGETKRHLHERFGEHRHSVVNHQQLANTTPVSEHVNLLGHYVNDTRLSPLELIHTNQNFVRKVRKAFFRTSPLVVFAHPFFSANSLYYFSQMRMTR